jgi:hypothetical protein
VRSPVVAAAAAAEVGPLPPAPEGPARRSSPVARMRPRTAQERDALEFRISEIETRLADAIFEQRDVEDNIIRIVAERDFLRDKVAGVEQALRSTVENGSLSESGARVAAEFFSILCSPSESR